MTQDSFILVNLREKEAKRLAQIISNETSRKILDYLSQNKDGTATSIAKELDIPLSTAHYNLKHLLEAKLIQVDEFHYSEKGKEVDHYKISNKFVIIAPQSTKLDIIKEKLGSILPVAGLLLIGAGVVNLVSKIIVNGTMIAQDSIERVGAAPKMLSLDEEMATVAIESVNNYGINTYSPLTWFLIGAFTALGLYLIISYIRKK